ncbi:MGMT family protein [Sinomonas humi]|uniref:Cysteine methyltransferase n=1 Tax=Sinomonas humi TaxID=1338436 RepID=A0A0B2AIK0_9MICC|nr:MGMT family protein [Sinomonas humi]KHL01666.1 cysteine methyltransferase [Sinomonas humi]
MRDEFVEAVLAVVELVPPGSVLAYGDVAELLGAGGPRQVGSVMSHFGAQVAWWRVIRANGGAPEGHEVEALGHYVEESTPLRGVAGRAGWRVDMQRARWAPDDGELDLVDAVAEELWERVHGRATRMSDPNGGLLP